MNAKMTIAVIAFAASVLCQNDPELNKSICDDSAKFDKELKLLLKEIKARYRDDSQFLSKLKASQSAWEAYSEAHIAMKFPAKNKQQTYGDMYPTCVCLEKIILLKKRIAELNAWKTGIPEGDVCPGSVLKEK
jgi:hypothetical protein